MDEKPNILVIAPHMDDEVLGCGGAIARHAAAGHSVTVCVCANRVYEHEFTQEADDREKRACEEAKKILGYSQSIFLNLPDEKLDRSQISLIVPIEKVIQEILPKIVYFPHRGDNHQDHRAVFKAVRVACRPFAKVHVPCLRVYEVISSTDQVSGFSEWPFHPNYYVNISQFIERKIMAMACYSTEERCFPHPRSPEGISVQAKKRGMEVGMEAAEAFVVVRDQWR